MGVKIITDTSSDLSQEYIDKNDIGILPLNIIFGDTSYIPGVEISTEQFYEKLAVANELPKTAQCSPAYIQEVFQEALNDGDDVVAILISSDMSGLYNTSNIVKHELAVDNIHICDSRTVTHALALLVIEAVKMRDEGKSASEIFEQIEVLKEKIVLYAVVGTLKYLQMGGRLSSTSAIIGTVLNIKPIITIKNGMVEAIDKQRGQKNAFDSLVNMVKCAGIDTEYTKLFAHTHATDVLDA
ncbi:MAG: DegV family protein, partial [Oscillospiraceae bacterium]